MVRVRDLIDQTGMVGPRPFLYCARCGAEYSANKGDYFLASPEYIFRCCEDMQLVTKVVEYKRWKGRATWNP